MGFTIFYRDDPERETRLLVHHPKRGWIECMATRGFIEYSPNFTILPEKPA